MCKLIALAQKSGEVDLAPLIEKQCTFEFFAGRGTVLEAWLPLRTCECARYVAVATWTWLTDVPYPDFQFSVKPCLDVSSGVSVRSTQRGLPCRCCTCPIVPCASIMMTCCGVDVLA